ncbi:hypothetical protein PAG51_05295 [Klebsiella pneumoniae]|uniref:DUF6945 domain-containing protein n=1 Tax=Enterobacteriaceae TaxID=543 RepID=UPI000DE6A058|nr:MULTISPECIES: hypothetical protein [Enterobacteriaceae]MDR4654501.1 hypothetical protein [Klebsiella pneumoniae]MEB7941974.1 hypothetical protein [Raoultella ornithinolytica]SSW60264.1 Uncharacterised protein [Klebsiella quasipneumoniae]BBV42677.1 hypothetical protein STW0522CIT26_41490 [Citrobacter portucalensis]BBV79981.1 hypothetical protein STW0522ENT60_06590 [Enterobacter kobei]
MTEAAKNKVITEPSLITAKRLTAHQIVVKDTNQVIRMTNDHRMVYSHLEDQFRGLTNPKNIAAGKSTGHYYDSDENLAIRCDVSEYIFKKVKKDLKALGLIDWIPPKARKSGHSCEYFVKSVKEVALNLEFIFQELPNGQPSYDHERVSGQKTNKSKPQAPQAETAATPSTDAPAEESTDTPADQGVGMAPEPAPVVVGQCDRLASNDDGSGDAGTDGNHAVNNEDDTTAGRPIIVTGYKTPAIQSKGGIYTPEEMARFAAEERAEYANGGTPF